MLWCERPLQATVVRTRESVLPTPTKSFPKILGDEVKCLPVDRASLSTDMTKSEEDDDARSNHCLSCQEKLRCIGIVVSPVFPVAACSWAEAPLEPNRNKSFKRGG